MSTLKRTLVLTGARAGKTVVLGKTYRFVEGKIVLQGASPDVEALTVYLGKCYAAFPEDSLELEAANGKRDLSTQTDSDAEQRVQREVQPHGPRSPKEASNDVPEPNEVDQGEKGVLPSGDGHQDSGVSRIWEAVTQLDTLNNDHWTAMGLPAVAAVESIINRATTRAEINAAAPNFNRGKE